MGTAAGWAVLCLSEGKQLTVELMEGSSATGLLHCLKAGSFLGNLPTGSQRLAATQTSATTHRVSSIPYTLLCSPNGTWQQGRLTRWVLQALPKLFLQSLEMFSV